MCPTDSRGYVQYIRGMYYRFCGGTLYYFDPLNPFSAGWHYADKLMRLAHV